MIFFLIAGTATPGYLLTGPSTFGVASLTTMWTLALVAATIYLAWMDAPELLVGARLSGWAGQPVLRSRRCGSTPVSRRPFCCSVVACSIRPEPFPTTAAGPARPSQCSATTRSFTPTSAPPPAITSR
jgi:hypothetical protein